MFCPLEYFFISVNSIPFWLLSITVSEVGDEFHNLLLLELRSGAQSLESLGIDCSIVVHLIVSA